jgi:hypothetical protein
LRLVALDTARTRVMEEQERVVRQVFERSADDVRRAREARMRVSDAPFGLDAPLP